MRKKDGGGGGLYRHLEGTKSEEMNYIIRSYPLDMLTICDRDHTVMSRMRGRRTMTLRRKPQKPVLLIVRSITAEILREIKEKTTPALKIGAAIPFLGRKH